MNTNFVQDAMHEVENLLKNAFTKAMQDGKLPEAEIPNFTVEIPAETTHGDFASNAAMVSARTFRNAPVKIANILKEEMDFFHCTLHRPRGNCWSWFYQLLCKPAVVC